MSLMLGSQVGQIAKILIDQKDLILSLAKIQNDEKINNLAEKYQEDINKLKTCNEELYNKYDQKIDQVIDYADSPPWVTSQDQLEGEDTNDSELSMNQIKSSIRAIKHELKVLKLKVDSREPSSQLEQKVEMLEQNFDSFLKDQAIDPDIQFDAFVPLYNSTMQKTREAIQLNHEGIMKLKSMNDDATLVKPLQSKVTELSEYVEKINKLLANQAKNQKSLTEGQHEIQDALKMVTNNQSEISQSVLSSSHVEDAANLQEQITFYKTYAEEAINLNRKSIAEDHEEIMNIKETLDSQAQDLEEIEKIQENLRVLRNDLTNLGNLRAEDGNQINLIQQDMSSFSEQTNNRLSKIEEHDLFGIEDAIRCIKHSLKQHVQKINNTLTNHSNELEQIHNILTENDSTMSKYETDLNDQKEELNRVQTAFEDMQGKLQDNLDEIDLMRLAFKEAKDLGKSVDLVKEELKQRFAEDEGEVVERSINLLGFDDNNSNQVGNSNSRAKNNNDPYQALRDELAFLETNFIETANLHTVSIEDHQQQLTSIKEEIENQKVDEQSLQMMQIGIRCLKSELEKVKENARNRRRGHSETDGNEEEEEESSYFNAQINAKVKSFEQSIDDLKKDVLDLTDLNKMKFEVEIVKRQMKKVNEMESVLSKFIALSEENDSDKQLLRCLKHEVARLKKNVHTINEQSQEEKINSANTLSTIKSTLDNLASKFDQDNQELSNLVQRSTLIEGKVDELISKQADSSAKLSTLESSNSQNTERVEQISSQVNENQNLLNSIKDKLSTIEGKTAELSKLQQESLATIQNLTETTTNSVSELNQLKEFQRSIEEKTTKSEDDLTKLTNDLEELKQSVTMQENRLKQVEQTNEQSQETIDRIMSGFSQNGHSIKCIKHEIKILKTFSRETESRLEEQDKGISSLNEAVERNSGIENKIEKALFDIQSLTSTVGDLSTSENEHKQQLSTITEEVQNLESSLSNVTESTNLLENKINEISEKQANDSDTLLRIQNSQSEITSKLEQVENSQARFEEAAATLTTKVEAIETNNEEFLRRQKANSDKISTLNETTLQHTQAIDELKENTSTAVENSKKATTKVSAMEEDFIKINQSLRKDENDIANIRTTADDLVKLQNTDAKNIKALQSETEDLQRKQQREYEEVTTLHKSLQNEVLSLGEKERADEREIYKLQGRITDAENHLVELNEREKEDAQNIEENQQKIAELQNEVATSQQNIKELQKGLETANENINQLQEKTQAHEESINNLQRDVQENKENIKEHQNHIHAAEQNITKLFEYAHNTQESINQLQVRAQAAEDNIKQLQQDVQEDKANIKQLQDQVQTAETNITELQEKAQAAENSINELQEKAQAAENSINELQEKAQAAENSINELQEKAQAAENSINELQEKAQTAENSINELKEKSQAQEESINELHNHVESAEQNIGQLQEKAQSAEEGINQLKEQAQASDEKINKLQEDVQAGAEAIKSQSEKLESIEQKQQEHADQLTSIKNQSEPFGVIEREINLPQGQNEDDENNEYNKFSDADSYALRTAVSNVATGVINLGNVMGRLEQTYGKNALTSSTEVHQSLQSLENELSRLKDNGLPVEEINDEEEGNENNNNNNNNNYAERGANLEFINEEEELGEGLTSGQQANNNNDNEQEDEEGGQSQVQTRNAPIIDANTPVQDNSIPSPTRRNVTTRGVPSKPTTRAAAAAPGPNAGSQEFLNAAYLEPTIKCLKHEVAKLRQQHEKDQDQLAALQNEVDALKFEISTGKTTNASLQRKITTVEESMKRLDSDVTHKLTEVIKSELQTVKEEIESVKKQSQDGKDSASKSIKSFEKSINNVRSEIENQVKEELQKNNKKQENEFNKLTKTVAKLKKELYTQFNEFKEDINKSTNQFETAVVSIRCVKHEMRKLRIQVDDNNILASKVDNLQQKFKKWKSERSDIDSNVNNAPADDSIQQIIEDMKILKQNFIETYQHQNESISNQSSQIKAIRKIIDTPSLPKFEKRVNERLKEVESKLGIVYTNTSANSSVILNQSVQPRRKKLSLPQEEAND